MRNLIICLAGLALVASCGDSDTLKCAAGTFPDGTSCAAHDPNDKAAPVTTASPTGGRSRAPAPTFVVLTSNEAATIHYTTDGTDPDPAGTGELSPVTVPNVTEGMTIKYFAIDLAGNREATHTDTYTRDLAGPPAVTGLAITVSGATATVTWTNPTGSDFAGTILARIADLADASPVPGMKYPNPTALSTSVQIVSSGTGTSFTDPGLPTGLVRYVAWTFDDLGNYGPPKFAQANVGTIDLSATFTFDTGSNTLTQTAAAASLDLSATTATYDAPSTTLTLHLSVKNITNVGFQNPKAEVGTVTNATFTGSAGTADGLPFASLGHNTLGAASTVTADLVFTGAAASTVVTIDLALGHHPSLYSAQHTGCCSGKPLRMVDSGSGVAFSALPLQTAGRSGRFGGLMRPGVPVGGHFLDVPSTHGAIDRWDLQTMLQVGGGTIGASRQNIMAVLAGGGSEFAISRSGGKRNSGTLTVTKVDESLQQVASLDIPISQHGFNIAALSADSSMLAVPANTEIVLVDANQLTQIDADTSTTDVDTIDPGFAGDRVRQVAFFNGTSGIVALSFNGTVSIIKRAGTGYTVTTTASVAKGNSLFTAADGRVWIGDDNNLRIYDPLADTLTASAYPNGVRGITSINGQLWVLRSNRQTVESIDSTGAVLTTMSLQGQVQGHFISATDAL